MLKRLRPIAILTLCGPLCFAQVPDSTAAAPLPAADSLAPVDTAVVDVIAAADSVALADSLAMAEDTEAVAEPAGPVILSKEDSVALLMEKVDSLLAFGSEFVGRYVFETAEEFYSTAFGICPDDSLKTAIQEEIDKVKTARRITSRMYTPKVVAKQMLCIDDFFLYYPLPDKAWHPVDGAPAVYSPDAGDEVYVSGDDSRAALFPMFSEDRMYFSSDSLPGIGGYDIFVCEWNENDGEWGEPRNIGFPYNSVADDFLFVDSPDGRYSLFSSNRDCPADSVYTFVVEYEKNPEASTVPDKSKLEEFSRLEPSVDPDRLDLGGLNSESFFDADTKIIRSGAYTFTLKSIGHKVRVIYN